MNFIISVQIPVLAILVQLVQHDVGKHLGQQVADGHSHIVQPAFKCQITRPHAGRQSERLPRVIDDALQKRHQFRVTDSAPQNPQKHGMVYPVEILGDVQFQVIPVGIFRAVDLAQPVLQALHRLVTALCIMFVNLFH